MKNDTLSERAAALVHQVIEVFQRTERAPDSPMTEFLPPKLRREYRRQAARLRQGDAQPRYRNLCTAEELADIYERTIRRDEIFGRALEDLRRLMRELGRMVETDRDEVAATLEAVFREAERAAEKDGPGSEAAHRYWIIRFVGWLDHRSHSQKRRRRSPAPGSVSLAMDPSVEARWYATAAEVLRSRPFSVEPVIAFPPEGSDCGRERMFIRIGAGYGSWIGHFELGHAPVSTISMMPDDKHLFVSAGGAGYIIEFKSRTLVETIGTEVIGVMRDEPGTLFVVNHTVSLEAFGRTGRLWKTDAFSSRGFRNTVVSDTSLLGEAYPPALGRWVPFAVKLATGEVELDFQ